MTLIVGQDVADTIAADHVVAALGIARADAKRARDAVNTSASPGAPALGGGEAGGDDTGDEEARKQRARAERAAVAAERERAAVFNEQLGVAIVNTCRA